MYASIRLAGKPSIRLAGKPSIAGLDSPGLSYTQPGAFPLLEGKGLYGVHGRRRTETFHPASLSSTISPPPKVTQELTYMGVWLRIPLVHPEAMDPDYNGDRSSTSSSTSTASSNASVEDVAVDVGAANGSSKDAPSAGAEVSGRPENAAAGVGKSAGARAGVEDPWETWNAVRVLCEHKGW